MDDRAIQLAQLGLYIKARKKRRTIANLQFKVVSSDFFLPNYAETRHIFESGTELNRLQKELIADIWSDLQYAYKFGSLIRLDEKLKYRLNKLENKQNTGQLDLLTGDEILELKDFTTNFFINLKHVVEQYAQTLGNKNFIATKTRDAIIFLELLTTEYDVATANPPYTDSSDFGIELKAFIEKNYKQPKFNTNLYAAFIKRCYDFTGKDSKIAMIHPDTFMFIKSFEDVRMFLLEKMHINTLVHFGTGGVFGTSLRVIYPVLNVLEKSKFDKRKSIIIDLRYLKMDAELERSTLNSKLETLDYISIDQDKFLQIPSSPFIYWISDEFREKFKERSIETVFSPKNGLQTGNNNKYLRFWWEITSNKDYYNSQKKWILYSKGGPFNKWFGNLWVTVNWDDTGAKLNSNNKGFFKEGVTFSGTGNISFRYLPEGNTFDNDAPLMFPISSYKNIFYCLAFINSKLATYIISCLNPTIKTQVGDIKRIPFPIPTSVIDDYVTILSKINVDIKKTLTKYSLVELNFIESPFKGDFNIKKYFNYENFLTTQILINEAIIDEKIFEVYLLTKSDKDMVLTKEGQSVGRLPISIVARTAYFAEEASHDFPLDNIRDFINELPIFEFKLEEQSVIESELTSLFQSNNNLEAFCVRYQVNPINVWYWFKQSNVIPKQRMNDMAMEFLADIIREILMEDEDGIIPLVPNAGEKILLDRIEEKFRERGFTSAQYANFDSVLGRPLNNYLNTTFFAALSDHLNLFLYLPKTPFIWHLSSGPEQGFDCYIIIYKWSRDKLLRIRSVYIEHRERALMNRQSDLANNDSADAQNEKEKIFKQLKEIEAFKVKIDELLAEGYNPILDDGVGKNIAPLQKKKMIPYEVLNPGQLKKYLNADW